MRKPKPAPKLAPWLPRMAKRKPKPKAAASRWIIIPHPAEWVDWESPEAIGSTLTANPHAARSWSTEAEAEAWVLDHRKEFAFRPFTFEVPAPEG